MFFFDLETFLISPGGQFPPGVCVQWADGPRVEDTPLVHFRDARARDRIEQALHSEVLVGHNVSFDIGVIAATWPHLIEPIFQAYAEDRILCTLQGAKLVDIAKRGMQKGAVYDLGAVADRFGVEVDKSDPWRLRYGTLFNLDVSEWPADAVQYARRDAWAQRLVTEGLIKHAHEKRIPLDDWPRQSRADWLSRLASGWGIRTDADLCRRAYHAARDEMQRAREIAQAAGLIRWNGKRDTKAAQAAMVAACAREGVPIPRTETGAVQVNKDAVDQVHDDVLDAYVTYTSASGTMKKIARFWYGSGRTPLHPRYNTLVNTGRMSCSQGDDPKPDAEGVLRMPSAIGVQAQNPPKAGNVRETIVPRPGHVFSIVDMNSFELVGWAQACFTLVGESRLREVLNDGRDPHTEFGASIQGITVEEAYRLKKTGDAFFKNQTRQAAKIADFGFPGGMGAAKLRTQARASYGFHMTLEYTQNLQRLWRAEWPENRAYFRWVDRTLGGAEYGTVVQLYSNRQRGGITYTSGANTLFQGLCADAFKAAWFLIARECYTGKQPDGKISPLSGARPIIPVHDELVIEVPHHSDDQLQAAALRHRELMVSGCQPWFPDVLCDAEPTLSRVWTKAAEAVWDGDRLCIWERKK